MKNEHKVKNQYEVKNENKLKSGERWQQVSSIFHDALGRDEAARTQFLRQACGTDESLRCEVESLLGSYERAGSIFDESAFERATRELVRDESEALLDQTIGSYRIVRLLGAGGMGEVYLANDTKLSRLVAVKFLPAHFAADLEQVKRFQLEARAASSLNHPNILTIHETGEHNGRHYIVMEYVAGSTLRETLAESTLTLAEKLDVTIQVCDALAAAHAAGIIHRDIKPENIMLRPDGYAKVLDFGLAKLTETDATTQPGDDETEARRDVKTDARANVETAAGVLMGTVRYMSPEQVRGLRVDVRTDVWSLGVVLYEMLEGKPPFVGATSADTVVSLLEREPAPLTAETPLSLARCVLKALDKDRDKRFASAREFADELRKIRREVETGFTSDRTTRGQVSASNHKSPTDKQTASIAHEHTAPTLLLDTDALEALHAQRTNAASGFKNRLTTNPRRLTLFALVLICAVALPFVLIKFNESMRRRERATRANTTQPTQTLPAQIDQSTRTTTNAPAKDYREMTEAERSTFIAEQTFRLSQMLGEGATQIDADTARAIKWHVDFYDGRRDNRSPDTFKESLSDVYARAALYAPLFSYHFKRRGVPSIVGIYIPMIESEYHDCLTSPYGAQGKFQFLEQTARNYGIRPEDRCNVDVIAPVAARYIRDRTTEFGTDAASMTLVIASFNRGTKLVREDLKKIERFTNGRAKPDFWFLLAHANELDEQFRGETRHYVPKFFAAAIVGENPQAFGLNIMPLSALASDQKK